MARDPDRIRPTLNSLQSAWEQNPDMRFGQLLESLYWEAGKHGYYIEDDVLAEAADRVAKEGWKPRS